MKICKRIVAVAVTMFFSFLLFSLLTVGIPEGTKPDFCLLEYVFWCMDVFAILVFYSVSWRKK